MPFVNRPRLIPWCGIGHERPNSVPGLVTAMPALAAMGVEVRRISRQVSYVVESSFQPVGASFTASGDVDTTTSDLIAEECRDGTSTLLRGATAATATFTPDLPKDANYRLFVGFPMLTTNCDQARVTVNSAAEQSVVILNQQVEPNRWHYIGTFPFRKGTLGSVTLDSQLCTDPTHYVVADCVKWQYDTPYVYETAAATDWHLLE